MKIRVERYAHDAEATASLVYLDGAFFCHGLEDQPQVRKVPGETRIPAGTYQVQLRREGGMHSRYADKFPEHRGMLWLQDVPGFEWVYIHIGNTDDHTEGCILVGETAGALPGRFTLSNSTAAYRRLYRAVADAAAAGTLSIEIIDRG